MEPYGEYMAEFGKLENSADAAKKVARKELKQDVSEERKEGAFSCFWKSTVFK